MGGEREGESEKAAEVRDSEMRSFSRIEIASLN